MTLPATGPTGFHEGELLVQRRAGGAEIAAGRARMVGPGHLRDGMADFLAERTFAALTARDADGHLWNSPLAGPIGFLEAEGATSLAVHARPLPGDALHDLPAGQRVGLIAIEFATRRRVRVNGTLTATGATLRIDVEQAYGNCPKYITPRALRPLPARGRAPDTRRSQVLDEHHARAVRAADTVLVGTSHPTSGADASHRGGPAGFVRVVDDRSLWWPEFDGNKLFNTLGNLVVDPAVALLVPDFAAGTAVQISGRATLEWSEPGGPGDDGHTGQRVVVSVEQVVSGDLLPVRADAPER